MATKESELNSMPPLLLLLQFSNIAFMISIELFYRDLIRGKSDPMFVTLVFLNVIELSYDVIIEE